MQVVTPMGDLGRFHHDWLNARYHFSFADYHDENRMQWGPLRVWNDDEIKAGHGFGLHPHRDMEIITYVRTGAISHRDHLGNQGRIAAGEVQVMSAGTGIQHAEFNHEPDETSLFQIWIQPHQRGLRPRWAQMKIETGTRTDPIVPLVSGRLSGDSILPMYQDATLWQITVPADGELAMPFDADRLGYLVPAGGAVILNDEAVPTRAGVKIAAEPVLRFKGTGTPATIILADLPGRA